MKKIILVSLVVGFTSCGFSPFPQDVYDDDATSVSDIEGEPTEASKTVYNNHNLNDLCQGRSECAAPYEPLPASFSKTLATANNECLFDYNVNRSSSFIVKKSNSDHSVDVALSKEDLFFLAWVSIQYKINPHFLLGTMLAESRGNCRLVSPAHGEGCFQITNTFGQSQLDDSYFDFIADWNWSERSGEHYPEEIFIDEVSYFGATPDDEQFRMTLDPLSPTINDVSISSTVNFHFGIIASGLYYQWQQYMLFTNDEDLQEKAIQLFQSKSGKALWQAAAYNGGAYGATNALDEEGNDFLEGMLDETQDYADRVVDYCEAFSESSQEFDVEFSKSDINFMIDLLAQVYPSAWDIDWTGLKEHIRITFFETENSFHYRDDIKAVIFEMAQFDPRLAPLFPHSSSI